MYQDYGQSLLVRECGYGVAVGASFRETGETRRARRRRLKLTLSKAGRVSENEPGHLERREDERNAIGNRSLRFEEGPRSDLIVDRETGPLIGMAGRPAATVDAGGKLGAELAAFERMRADLLEKYRGRFVAIHRGQVVDDDCDEFSLGARIEERARREGAIAICRVSDAPAEGVPEYPYYHFESPMVREEP